jgi:hypothetical protein
MPLGRLRGIRPGSSVAGWTPELTPRDELVEPPLVVRND